MLIKPKTVQAAIECPKCHSANCSLLEVDKIDFRRDNTGFYAVNYRCCDCLKPFKLKFGFNYKITDFDQEY